VSACAPERSVLAKPSGAGEVIPASGRIGDASLAAARQAIVFSRAAMARPHCEHAFAVRVDAFGAFVSLLRSRGVHISLRAAGRAA